MKKLALGLLIIGLVSNSIYAKQIKVCNVLRSYDVSTLPIACEGNFDKKTTLKKMYKKGWKFIGTSASGSGGTVVILEK